MITNNFNKELRGISDALRDLGYTDSTIGLRQRYWKEYCFFHAGTGVERATFTSRPDEKIWDTRYGAAVFAL